MLGIYILFGVILFFCAYIVLRLRSEANFRVPWVSLEGKYLIITGSNSGIGKEMTIILARMSPEKIIMGTH